MQIPMINVRKGYRRQYNLKFQDIILDITQFRYCHLFLDVYKMLFNKKKIFFLKKYIAN